MASLPRHRPGKLVEREAHAHPALARFDDADPKRWLNPNLPFGGVAVPRAGLAWEVREPAADAPPGTRATVVFSWKEPDAAAPAKAGP